MNTWQFSLICPRCNGTNMKMVTTSRVATINTTSNATVECVKCQQQWVLTVALHPMATTPRTRMPSNIKLDPKPPIEQLETKPAPVERHPLVTACMAAENEVGPATRRARANAQRRVRSAA